MLGADSLSTVKAIRSYLRLARVTSDYTQTPRYWYRKTRHCIPVCLSMGNSARRDPSRHRQSDPVCNE